MVKNIVKTSVNSLVDNEKNFFSSLTEISNFEANLGCIDGKIIGTGQPDYTQGSTEYKLLVNENEFLLIDIPGIEGNETKYKTIISDSLAKAHLIFYVNGSGKKAEKDTLEKIKKYMHDGTSVYALFNVHCKAKKNRVEGIDKTYAEELADAYKKQNEIVIQTEDELKSFLGENFKGSVSLNGLLSFCTVAVDNRGNSTIINDKDKNLRSTQSKFLKEYSGDFENMQRDSHIDYVQDIVAQKIEHFDGYIVEENLKKLKTRLSDVLLVITSLKNNEKAKIKNFLRDYCDFEKSCENAKYDFAQAIRRIGRNEVEPAFFKVRDVLFKRIEDNNGKIKAYDIEDIFNQYEENIIEDIEKIIGDKINDAVNEYQESIKEAENRLFNDLQREQKKFEFAMQTDKIILDTSFINSLKFTAKDFTKGAFKLGGYVFSGVTIGSLFPGLGNIVGGFVGLLVGICEMIWGWFASKAKRINKAKAKLQEALDDQIDCLVDELKQKIKALGLETKINRNHSEIQKNIEHQRNSLHNIEQLLDVVEMSLNNSFNKINN